MEIVCYITTSTSNQRLLIFIIDTNRTDDIVLGAELPTRLPRKKIHRLKEVIDFYAFKFKGSHNLDLVVDQLETFFGVGEDSPWKLVCVYKI